MALSEREQQVFERLERQLHEHDPGFALRLGRTSEWFDRRRRLILGALGVVAGLALLLAFCLTTVVALGVGGFLVLAVSLDRCWSAMGSLVLSTVARRRSATRTPPPSA